MYHKHVKKSVALNPVARAVARKALQEAITTRKIELYMMSAGDPCEDVCARIGFTLSVIAAAAQRDPKVGEDDPRVRILRGAISACVQMADADKYETTNTVALDRALDLAVELNGVVDPALMNQVFNEFTRAGA
jgi:hypothetical protein